MMSKFTHKLDEIERMKMDIARMNINIEEDMKKMGSECEINKSNIAKL